MDGSREDIGRRVKGMEGIVNYSLLIVQPVTLLPHTSTECICGQ